MCGLRLDLVSDYGTAGNQAVENAFSYQYPEIGGDGGGEKQRFFFGCPGRS